MAWGWNRALPCSASPAAALICPALFITASRRGRCVLLCEGQSGACCQLSPEDSSSLLMWKVENKIDYYTFYLQGTFFFSPSPPFGYENISIQSTVLSTMKGEQQAHSVTVQVTRNMSLPCTLSLFPDNPCNRTSRTWSAPAVLLFTATKPGFDSQANPSSSSSNRPAGMALEGVKQCSLG